VKLEEKQRANYLQEQQLKEQQMMDDLFNARRAFFARSRAD
jgi:flagellar biosynthesis chaperone FliJ